MCSNHMYQTEIRALFQYFKLVTDGLNRTIDEQNCAIFSLITSLTLSKQPSSHIPDQLFRKVTEVI